MMVCPKHLCYLEKSDVLAKSEKVFTLSSAEEHTPILSPNKCGNSALINYSLYMTSVFASPMNLSTDTPISSIFYYALQGTKYMPNSTKARNTKILSEDLKTFYESIGLTEFASIYQIQRTLLSDRFNFSVVCQIAYFLGLSVKDLTEPSISKDQIASEQASHYMLGKAPINWDTLDQEIAPQLEQLAYNTYYGINGRPSRVSEKMIYRELQLNAHSLDNLPISKAILNKYAETYEEAYARRLIWAYNQLHKERESVPFCWSDLRRLSGVKKENIKKVIPYIFRHTTLETAEQINNLIFSQNVSSQ
jgi:hypothetical protein